MKPKRRLNRRSFLVQVAAGGIVGGALATISGNASAFQITDRDPSDPVGRGRGGGTGITDRDSGAGADPVGRGRGTRPGQGTGITDSDSGAGADPAGRGRGGTRVTDSDRGPAADPPGRGRGSGSQAAPGPNVQLSCERLRQRELELRNGMAGQSYFEVGRSLEELQRVRASIVQHCI